MPEKQPNAWVRGAVWALGAGLGVVIALGGALYTDMRSDVVERADDLGERIAEISRRKQLITAKVHELDRAVSALEARLSDHKQSAEEWKSRIERTERGIHELSSVATARPDPFTGTEGRALERRLDALELRHGASEKWVAEIARLRKELSELQMYWRRMMMLPDPAASGRNPSPQGMQ